MLGGSLDPHAAYLLLRGMKTLRLRVLNQNDTCMELARRLEAHPKVAGRALGFLAGPALLGVVAVEMVLEWARG